MGHPGAVETLRQRMNDRDRAEHRHILLRPTPHPSDLIADRPESG